MNEPSREAAQQEFEQLFGETRTALLAYLLRRAATAEDAADLLAETYLIAWRRFRDIPPGEAARLWLFRVARNLLMKGATRERSRSVLVARLARELERAGTAEPTEDARTEPLDAALRALPKNQREVLLFCAWEGLTPREIAAVTGTPVNLVRVRLHRARTTLQRDLDRALESKTGTALGVRRRRFLQSS